LGQLFEKGGPLLEKRGCPSIEKRGGLMRKKRGFQGEKN